MKRGPKRSAVVLAMLGLCGPLSAQTVLPEIQVTTSAVPDFEFDSARNGVNCPGCNAGDGNSRLAFTDRKGQLWLGKVDFATGAFKPEDGRGKQIDSFTAPVTCFGNGPEWMSSASGSQIVYTRFVNGSGFPAEGSVDCTASSPQIAIASLGSNGWKTKVLADSLDRVTPDGSKDDSDTDPRLNYVQADKEALFWRQRSALPTEVEMPINDLTGGNSRRWVPGTRKIIFQGHLASDPRLLDQVYLFDTDTLKREQLTSDSVTKAGGFMWRAPEYGNEYVFFTMANFRQEIWIYRKLTTPSGKKVWTVSKKVKAPREAGLPFFWSPEVFTHNGRSYIFTQVSPSNKFFDKGIPTHLAITGIDPLKADLRLLTNDTTKPRVRLDPEYFITAKGPFIYYNRLVPATDEYPDGINDGVWRVDTKLGPPKP